MKRQKETEYSKREDKKKEWGGKIVKKHGPKEKMFFTNSVAGIRKPDTHATEDNVTTSQKQKQKRTP